MLDFSNVLIQLGLSIVCGFIIGLERQINKGLAGIHTNVLVSAGSCLFIFVSTALQDTNSPARVASQIVSGIGFLGAGVIAKEGMTVRGINSAATLWCSAAIGSLCGAGIIQYAFVGTVIITISNYIVRHRYIKQLYKKTSYNLVIHCSIEATDAVIQYVESKSSTVLLNKFEVSYTTNESILNLHLIDYENTLDSRKTYIQDLAKYAIGIQRCAIEIA
jgi:putative Mg2+ transporter-C (MgtC) family protein